MLNGLPGFVIAVDEDRTDDAHELADQMLEEMEPYQALYALAKFALVLHKSPETSLKQFSIMMSQGVELDGSSLPNSTIGLEFVDILEGWNEGVYSDEARTILDRFDLRPGSAKIIEYLADVTNIVVSAMAVQKIMKRRSIPTVKRVAFLQARASVQNLPLEPNLLSSDWDDLDDNGEPLA